MRDGGLGGQCSKAVAAQEKVVALSERTPFKTELEKALPSGRGGQKLAKQ